LHLNFDFADLTTFFVTLFSQMSQENIKWRQIREHRTTEKMTFVEFLHNLPHVDRNLHDVDNTFDLNNDKYVEALGMIGVSFWDK
jgi:hypothetical protein